MEAFLLAWMMSLASGREALRFEPVHEQKRDLSCGLAAAASLADLYWGLPCREEELAARLAPAEGSEERATDLAELAFLLEGLGFEVRTVRLDPDTAGEALRRGYAPLVLHLRDDGGHFALLLGMSGGTAALADPVRGLTTRGGEEFRASFTGGALAAVLPGGRLERRRLEEAAGRALEARRFLETLAEGALR